MEQDTQEKTPKSWFKNFGWPHFFLILSSIGLGYDLYNTHQEKRAKEDELVQTNVALTKEREVNTTYSYLTDSLKQVNANLSIYKALTMAMVHRDEATSQLSHKVGDIVYLKNDSSKVVIANVIIGGSKFNYYMKYVVLFKDNNTKELIPELIY